MIVRMLLAAVVAGTLAGVFVTGAQLLKVVPLVMEAETYESGGHAHDATAAQPAAAESGGEAHAHADAGGPGPERLGLTLLANVVIGCGFGLLLVAAIALRGGAVDWRSGVLWGLGGYAAVVLAPAVGLPPELPGFIYTDIIDRQVWFLATAVATAAGLAAIAFAPGVVWKAAGAVLIAAPHVVGAPAPESLAGSSLPAELAAEFVVAALVTALAFWAVLGGLTGYFVDRWAQRT